MHREATDGNAGYLGLVVCRMAEHGDEILSRARGACKQTGRAVARLAARPVPR
jgi:hypothetical protein